MFSIDVIFNILVIQLVTHGINGQCPYASQLFEERDLLPNEHQKTDSSGEIYENYVNSRHRYTQQPPEITEADLRHAYQRALEKTDRYVLLDEQATKDSDAGSPPELTDADRNSVFLESASRFLQETSCLSKKSTTIFIPNLKLSNFKTVQNYTNPTRDYVARGIQKGRYGDWGSR